VKGVADVPRRKACDVLMVGSIPLSNSEAVFRALAAELGGHLCRMPDGETGPRLHWIGWQTSVFDHNPAFELGSRGLEADWRNKDVDPAWKLKPWHSIRPGVRPVEIEFGELGYSKAAKASYIDFAKLKQQGVIAPACRFQVCLPTPYNVIDQRVTPEHRLDVERPYEARLLAEVREIATFIPANELAIQWDAAHEVQNLEGGRPHWFETPEQGILDRLARLGNAIPPGIELGYHFCYGSFAGKHFIEPKDADIMTRLSNGLFSALKRSLQWLHLPVPSDRCDRAYYAPLRKLGSRPETRVYLGLVHLVDGVEGARRRIAAAREVLNDFGIATPCGFGRQSPQIVDQLLRLLADVAIISASPTLDRRSAV
jgi:hypothetical protein